MRRGRSAEIRPSRTPIGWKLEEPTFDDGIREGLGMEMPVDIAEITQDAYHVYTDGSYTGFHNLAAR